MAMIENGGADLGSSSHNFSEVIQGTKNFERNISDSNDSDQQIQEHLSRNQQKNQSGFHKMEPNLQKNAILQKKNAILHQNQQIFQPNQFHNVEHLMKVQQLQQRTVSVGTHKLKQEQQELKNGLQPQQSLQQQQQHGMMGKSAIVGGHQHPQQRLNGIDLHGNGEEGFKRDMRELVDLLSKLNPMAEEFVPPSLVNHGSGAPYSNNFLMQNNISGNGNNRRKKNNYSQGKRRMNSRTSMAQREEIIRRTVYVSDIDQQVTEEQLAALFINCGQVVDCRVCGDPNSVLRFAFIEFTDEEGARAALSLAGTMLGYYPVRVLPSKTAIAPVNPTFLPRSEDEREMCARTIYCTNIDKTVSQAELKLFFERICGAVFRLRLLGDYHHSTRIAFVEFVEDLVIGRVIGKGRKAESAIAALHCSGARLGSLPIRVSPSKTPVRPRAPRPPMH